MIKNSFLLNATSVEAGLWRLAENTNEALAYFGLRFDQCRVERRKIRHIGCTRQQPQEPCPGSLWIEFSGQAKTEDLGEVVINLHCGPKYFRVIHRQDPQGPSLVQRARGRSIKYVRQLMSMNELQILRNEFDIDQPAGHIFEIPAITISLFLGYGGAHLYDITCRQIGVAVAPQDILDNSFNSRLELHWSRNNPGPGERHMLPRPCFRLLIDGKGIESRGQRTRAARRAQPHIDLI